MILVDSNILMYAVGTEHPHRKASLAFLEKVSTGFTAAIIDAEVLQELLHRYTAERRWREALQVYDEARVMFPEVLAITAEVMDSARMILAAYQGLAARDAVHAAVVQVYGLDSICSYDKDFDRIGGIRRIEPPRR